MIHSNVVVTEKFRILEGGRVKGRKGEKKMREKGREEEKEKGKGKRGEPKREGKG